MDGWFRAPIVTGGMITLIEWTKLIISKGSTTALCHIIHSCATSYYGNSSATKAQQTAAQKLSGLNLKDPSVVQRERTIQQV